MQQYQYRARNPQGQIVGGVVQAGSVEAARKILQANSLVPIAVSVPHRLTDSIPFFNKVSLKDRTLFARQLATMIEAGLTLSQAMRLLIRQNKKGKFRDVMEAVLQDITDGFSFSTALAKFPDVFNAIFINVVRSGEATGKLEEVLLQLSTNMEKDVKIRGKLKGALMYPAFIILAMIGVATLMITQVIPQLKDLFLSSGKALPGSTQFLLNLSDFVTTKWYVVILIIAAVAVSLQRYLSTLHGQEMLSRLTLKLPVFGTVIQQSGMARFGRLLGMLLGSGVPLLEALKLIIDSFPNRVYRAGFHRVAVEVERGVPMSTPITENPAFPILVGQMVSVGEQTGKMDEVMTKMAEYYEAEVDSKVSGIATLIEPLVIVVLGIGVAYLVIAILLPIYSISTAIN